MSTTDKPRSAVGIEYHELYATPEKKQQRAKEPPNTPPLIPAAALASSRYNRQLLLPQLRLQGQEYLLSSKVLIIGLGGLGSPAALFLAGAGIGKLGFMDSDSVEVSNLHRQIVHTEAAARSGTSKVSSAASRCKELNSEIEYVCHENQASASNILDVVSQYDLVLDCTDSPATRYLISDACVMLCKVLISGAAQRGEGMLIVLNRPPVSSQTEEKGPCYRCVFPRPPAPETVRGCSEIGILGPVVGTIGTLMAGEAIKIISSGGHLLPIPQQEQMNSAPASGGSLQKNPKTMLLYNTYATDPRSIFRTITLRGRRKDCLACGDDETLAKKNVGRITADTISQGRLDYQAFCGVLEDVKLLSEENRVNAGEFLDRHARPQHLYAGGKRKRNHIVVDVREEHEYELGPKVSGSLNIPLSKILRHGGGAFDELESGSSTGLEGGVLDREEHTPMANERLSSAQNHDSATPNLKTGPGNGMMNQESYTPAAGRERDDERQIPTYDHVELDGVMLDQESHILVTRQAETDFPTATESRSNEGMIEQKSHVPVARQNTFSSAESPAKPDPEMRRAEGRDEEQGPPSVYFVCQRGNDSQIAAQKLLERVQAETAGVDQASRDRRKWGWIGDVKGGFLAMERHVSL